MLSVFVWAILWSSMRVSDLIVGFGAASSSDSRVSLTSVPVVRVALWSAMQALFCRRYAIEVVVGVSTVLSSIRE